jgi:hypothetical protein
MRFALSIYPSAAFAIPEEKAAERWPLSFLKD